MTQLYFYLIVLENYNNKKSLYSFIMHQDIVWFEQPGSSTGRVDDGVNINQFFLIFPIDFYSKIPNFFWSHPQYKGMTVLRQEKWENWKNHHWLKLDHLTGKT